jgi:site-specific DNA-methyltransferase (adenine-specific)
MEDLMTESRLHLGDCLELMKRMPDGCVDAVVTDPPYNARKDYGVYKDMEYAKWMRNVISESRRVSRKGIAFYVGGALTERFLELIPGSHLIIIEKTCTGPCAGDWLLQYHSLITTLRPSKKTEDLWLGMRMPSDGFVCREEHYNHPCQTGMQVTRKIVSVFTKESDVVFDPFMGTGTTGAVCAELGRNFVGCELNSKYYEMAQQRIASVHRPTAERIGMAFQLSMDSLKD